MALTGLTWSFQWYRTAAYGLFGVSTARPAMSAPQQQNKDEKKEKAEFDYGIWDNVVSELQALYPSYASISLTAGKAQISKPRVTCEAVTRRRLIPKQEKSRPLRLIAMFPEHRR